jgi:hypothetical protein
LFKTTKNSAKVVAQLVEWELDPFHCTHVDLDKCKCALTWWCMEKDMFLVMGFLAWQIFGIPTSKIEIDKIFSIAKIFMAFQRCQL